MVKIFKKWLLKTCQSFNAVRFQQNLVCRSSWGCWIKWCTCHFQNGLQNCNETLLLRETLAQCVNWYSPWQAKNGRLIILFATPNHPYLLNFVEFCVGVHLGDLITASCYNYYLCSSYVNDCYAAYYELQCSSIGKY